ncbi:MAG: hypothetical protein JJU40_00175 [Rhodobacteraceae bacterium]|nr:hypothetical protein [Paracoccaceae bacterium]
MSLSLPRLYFRTRDNGALVFRVDVENRQGRLDLEQIAAINIRSGEIKPQGNVEIADDEMAEIEAWMEARRLELAERMVDDIRRAIDHLNLTAQWAQSQATERQLEEITDALLLSMHDLRMVLVRKKSERLGRTGR